MVITKIESPIYRKPNSVKATPHFVLPKPKIIIKPRSGWQPVNWLELWHSRELLYFLVWRDLKVRYRQTLLGAGWVILQPLLAMVIFSVLFGWLVGLENRIGPYPYPLFVLAGLLPWNFFVSAYSGAAQSLVACQNLVTRVYFPRLLLPLAAVLVRLVDFVIALFLMIPLMFWYGMPPGTGCWLLPIWLLFVILGATGMGCLLAGLMVRYRDIGHGLLFLNQIWFYLTPILYPISLFPAGWRWLVRINPMTDLICGFRDSILGSSSIGAMHLFGGLAATLVLFFAGLAVFRRLEHRLADLV